MTLPGSTTLPRRRLRMTVLLALVMAGLFGCSTPLPPTPAPPPGQAQRRPVFMQVVAHEDDDILFMNPDLHNAVRSGAQSVTIYLTAGESDTSDANGYAASRQAGSRAAYARMAGVPDEWRSEVLTPGQDGSATPRVELYTLTARQQLQLIFVNLPDNNDPNAEGGKRALTRLWRDSGNRVRVRTLTPTGGVVRESYEYSRQDVVALFVALLKRFRPTLVRAQDGQPDRRYTAGWLPYHDHPDHVMAARFTNEAIRAYRAGTNPRLVQIGYRDYNTEEAPVNLNVGQQQEKVDLFATYAKHDSLVSFTGSYDAWPRRMYHRWPLGTTWAARDANDRVQAFLVQAGELLTWWQEPDGTWAGPASLGDARGVLAPPVSVARDAGGRLQVFARRLDDDQIVTITQSAAGDPRTWPPQWESLGNPNQNNGFGAEAELGVPVAVAGAGGTLMVFVRNATGGVSSRGQQTPGGAWQEGWATLGGTDVQDGLAATTTEDGRIELFATTRDSMLHWEQAKADAAFTLDDKLSSRPPAGPPAVAGTAGGPIRVFYKVAGTAEVLGNDQSPAGGNPPGATGTGGLAAIAAGPNILLLARSPGGAVIMATAGRGGWTEVGGVDIVDQPMAVRDAGGRIVLLGAGSDGRLAVNQQLESGAAPDARMFAGWRSVGS